MIPAVLGLLLAQGPVTVRLSGQAVAAFTVVDPVPRDSALAELRLVQPVAMLRAAAWGGRLAMVGTLNLEGATIPDGELAAGTWGEGFMDRRHPHTYAHELLLVARSAAGSVRWSAALGKGFVPFGTDDPMSRPPLRYPVNHHWSQILERAVVQAAVGAGPVTVEFAAFNGDEPERPDQWPNLERFGDSWSVRVSLFPRAGAELQFSHANVRSPEHRQGAAGDQQKWSASARWEGPLRGRPVYGMLEWARTSELDGFFVFHSSLLEVAATLGRHRPYARVERTERPEEHRPLDPFRSVRPHFENSILGITRWTIVTAGSAWRLRGPRLAVWPFAEVSVAHVASVTGGVFDPEDFYGRATLWSATLGIRLDAGLQGHRMGRYGVLSRPSHAH